MVGSPADGGFGALGTCPDCPYSHPARLNRFSCPPRATTQHRATNNLFLLGSIPTSAFFDRLLVAKLGGQPWDIPFWYPSTFFGGDSALLTYQLLYADGSTASAQTTLKFQILGKNPDMQIAKSYIQANEGSFYYAWAIAQEESRDSSSHFVYNQFANGINGSVGAHGAKGWPFYTPLEGNGWGMFQRDPTYDPTHPVTVDEVWNWHTNVSAAISELGRKQQAAAAYFAAVQRTYPAQWVAPPATYTPPGCRTQLSYMDAAVITLYNGASVVSGPLWNGQYDNKGNKIYVANFLSCWKFNQNTSQWTFVVNNENYVWKVTREYEGQAKPSL